MEKATRTRHGRAGEALRWNKCVMWLREIAWEGSVRFGGLIFAVQGRGVGGNVCLAFRELSKKGEVKARWNGNSMCVVIVRGFVT